MPPKILCLIPLLLFGCEKGSDHTAVPSRSPESSEAPKPMIRLIWFAGGKKHQGIELNGDRAYRQHGPSGTEKSEIPYEEGLKLIEEFYAIPGIERLRGTKNQPRENSTHYIIAIYDEKPGRYSKDWVDYLIPKDIADPQIRGWLDKMKL